MSGVTLFRDGTHITDVTFQQKGEIAVGSGGVGGEYYLRIPLEARPELLRALAEAAGTNVPGELDDDRAGEFVMALFLTLFKRTDADPYSEIEESLRSNDIEFRPQYWPSR